MVTIVLQRGHVPRTSGSVGAPGEQAFAIDVAGRLAPLLRASGHRVRVIDADPPSEAAYRGDLFVSLHYDSSGNTAARGASVGYQTDEGRQLAAKWKRHYADAGWTGGFRSDNYTPNLAHYYGVRAAVRQGNRVAFICEAGFHSNPHDAALLRAPAGPERVARSIAHAIAEFTGTPPPGGGGGGGTVTEPADIWRWQTTGAHPEHPDDDSKRTRSREMRDHLGAITWYALEARNAARGTRDRLDDLPDDVRQIVRNEVRAALTDELQQLIRTEVRDALAGNITLTVARDDANTDNGGDQ